MTKSKNNKFDNLIVLEKEKYESIGDYAVRCIEYNIINMILYPGIFVSEKCISDMLSISRTPIREAFYRLEKLNLIEIYPQKGTMVSLIDVNIIEETSFMRKVIEKEIINIVCKTRSEEDIELLRKNIDEFENNINTKNFYELLMLDIKFHQILFSIANKALIYNIILDSIKHFNRFRIFNIMEMDIKKILLEHKKLFEYIKDKNSNKALKLMEQHLTNVIDDMSFLKEKFPHYFKN